MSSCDRVREALSASLDGEATPADLVLVSQHVSDCVSCSTLAARMEDVTLSARVAAAVEVPDLSARIVRGMADELEGRQSRRAERGTQLRVVAGLAAVAQLVLALPSLVGAVGHTGRDLAAFEVALGLCIAVAAARPRLAGGLVPFVALVAVASVATAVIELATGQAQLLAEFPHVLPALALPVLYALSLHERDGRVSEPVASP